MSKSINLMHWLVLFLFAIGSMSAAAEEDTIVMNADGDHVITYRSHAGKMVQVVWVSPTKIDPDVKWDVKVSPSKSDVFVYQYKWKNGKMSRQYLDGGRLIVSSVISDSQAIPSGWFGRITPDAGRSSGVIVAWSPREDNGGIKPGASRAGFGFKSIDLPGIGIMKLSGPITGYPVIDGGPSELSPIRNRMNEIQENDFIFRNTAIPKISVGNPFNVTTVLSGIQKHIGTDLVSMKLVDATLASQLDRLLQAAADAVKLGNTKAVREYINEARKLLKTHCPDVDDDDFDKDDDGKNKPQSPFIDKLAARVLNFDLKYVEKQLK